MNTRVYTLKEASGNIYEKCVKIGKKKPHLHKYMLTNQSVDTYTHAFTYVIINK